MINETKSWFSKKINKIDKPLTRLAKNKREWIQIKKMRNEGGEITTNIMDIQKKNHKKILQTAISQKIGHPRRNRQAK